LRNKLITPDQIISAYRTSDSLPADHFKGFITWLGESFERHGLNAKFSANCWVGGKLRDRRPSTHKKTVWVSDYETALQLIAQRLDGEQVFTQAYSRSKGEWVSNVDAHDSESYKDHVFTVTYFYTQDSLDLDYFIAGWVLSFETVLVHILYRKCNTGGRRAFQVSTDCVNCGELGGASLNQRHIDDYYPSEHAVAPFGMYWDEQEGVAMWKRLKDPEKHVLTWGEDGVGHFRDVPRKAPDEYFDPPKREWTHLKDQGGMDEPVLNEAGILVPGMELNREMIITHLEENRRILLTGPPGFGKTWLLIMIEAAFGGVDVLKLCPTNAGCDVMEGDARTLHRYFMTKFRTRTESTSEGRKRYVGRKTNRIKVLIVDEYSMMPDHFYGALMLMILENPDMIVVLCGDDKQLPPVRGGADWCVGDDEMDAEMARIVESDALFFIVNGARMDLSLNRRGTPEFAALFMQPQLRWSINPDHFKMRTLTRWNLAQCHRTRRRVNEICLEACPFVEILHQFKALTGILEKDKSQDVSIFEGMPLVSHRNLPGDIIKNARRYVVLNVVDGEEMEAGERSEAKVAVRWCKVRGQSEGDDDEEGDEDDLKSNGLRDTQDPLVFLCPISKFQRIFWPGYCVTIHAGQGSSYNDTYSIWDWYSRITTQRHRYVGFSRGRDSPQVQIAPEAVQVGPGKWEVHLPDECTIAL
jgi:hypothetical protein